MELFRLSSDDFASLIPLHLAYKSVINEDPPSENDLDALKDAVETGRMMFFVCLESGKPVGCCSVSITFSTFCYGPCGVFEDFFILPEFRHRGIARALARFAFENSGVRSMTVGCADCDLPMYRAIGFTVPLGNLFAFEA